MTAAAGIATAGIEIPLGPGGLGTDPVPAVQLPLWTLRPGPAAEYLDLPARMPAAIETAAGWDEARRVKEAGACCDVIGSGADALWAEPRSGSAARAGVSREELRDAVVTGLAILACRPGGAGFGGLHWHADPARCAGCPGPGGWAIPEPATAGGRGAVFTLRAMADDLVTSALRVIIQTVSMSPAADIERLRVADPSAAADHCWSPPRATWRTPSPPPGTAVMRRRSATSAPCTGPATR